MDKDPLFFGNDFVHWFGKVENNGDPLGQGRCQVRIIGWHNDSSSIPTAALPWAWPIFPIHNAAIGGIGHAPVGPQIGTKVWGFFADGKAAQKPVMIGSMMGDSVVENRDPIPFGASPAQPVLDTFHANTVIGREGDCPSGDTVVAPIITTATTTTQSGAISSSGNVAPIDPRTIVISPGEWVCPATGFISSPYGKRGSGHHNGVDICPAGFYLQTSPGASHLGGKLRGPVGNPILAAAAGQVVHTWSNNLGQGGSHTTYDINGQGSRSYGNGCAILHNLSPSAGNPSGIWVTIYGHLGTNQDPAQDSAGNGLLVKTGQTVTAGQQIGVMGRTHNRDSLTHLHFEIRVGATLPKCNNHIDPGRIFPQMAHMHTNYRAWGDSHKYNAPVHFDSATAPIIAGSGPTPIGSA